MDGVSFLALNFHTSVGVSQILNITLTYFNVVRYAPTPFQDFHTEVSNICVSDYQSVIFRSLSLIFTTVIPPSTVLDYHCEKSYISILNFICTHQCLNTNKQILCPYSFSCLYLRTLFSSYSSLTCAAPACNWQSYCQILHFCFNFKSCH